ncbi:MAG: hypothetical protein ACRESZ_03380 [Methylococcales bacterium]
MKNFLCCFVCTVSLSVATPTLAQQTAITDQTGSPLRAMPTAQIQPAKEIPTNARVNRKKPIKSSEVWRVQANKKVEWWQMPKPPIPETRRYIGASHMGH